MARFAALLLLLLAALPASAWDKAPNWIELRSPHFTILTDSSPKQAAHIAGQFERMRAVFGKLFPGSAANSSTAITVIACKNKKDFAALEPASYLGKGQLTLAGLFLPAADKNYILLRLDVEGEHPFAVVYHEYTHFLLRDISGWLPLWLNEGFAEFFQNTDITDKEVMLGQPSANDILFLRQNRLLPLATLLRVDRSSPYYHEEQKGSVFYAESWALTHFLEIADRQNNTQHVPEYARLVQANKDPVAAAEQAFGPLPQLQNKLEGYIAHGNYQLLHMKDATGMDESTFQTVPVTPTQADALRAGFLASVGRVDDAHALLDAVLHDDPKNVSAHETMGMLAFRNGNREAARKWYGEAVALDSGSYLAQYYWAAMSMAAGDNAADGPAIEKSLRAAIRLNPDFAPAYDQLAAFLATSQQHFDEAHLLNSKAIQLEPSNLDYRINAANVLLAAGRYAGAVSVLKAARQLAKTPAETARLERQQQQIELLEKGEASRKAADAAHATAEQQLTDAAHNPQGATPTVTEEPTRHPVEAASGPHHYATGVLHGVSCSFPAQLDLKMAAAGKSLSFYASNYYKIGYSAADYTPTAEMRPCTDLEGRRAKVEFAPSSDKTADGQIISIELSR